MIPAYYEDSYILTHQLFIYFFFHRNECKLLVKDALWSDPIRNDVGKITGGDIYRKKHFIYLMWIL